MTGTVTLTVAAGLLTGMIFSSLFVLPKTAGSAQQLPGLERLWRGVSARQQGIYQGVQWWRSKLAQPRLTLKPEVLRQWPAEQLEQHIDSLLTQAQRVDGAVADLEHQLHLPPQTSSTVSRLLALRQAVSPATPSVLPMQVTLPTDLLFEEGSTLLKPEGVTLLQNLESTLQSELQSAQGIPLTMTIATHTDNIGEVKHNLDLSFERSRVLQHYFDRQFHSGMRWTAVGYGASMPLVDNSTQSNRQRNRRVEITLNHAQ
jgi:outer membrane protein OmpA-like peptidoglycan-associated protein